MTVHLWGSKHRIPASNTNTNTDKKIQIQIQTLIYLKVLQEENIDDSAFVW